jgi:hypothetical protein
VKVPHNRAVVFRSRNRRLIYVRNNANIEKPVMPKISVVFYQEDAKTVPVLDWLDRLPARAQDKCRVRIERLRDLGMNYAGRKRTI